MVALILVVAGVLVAGGFYAVMTGADIIVLERGWSMVIAGSIFAAAGFVLAAIALLMRDLRRLAANLEFLPAREAAQSAGQGFDDEADFRPVVVPGVPVAPATSEASTGRSDEREEETAEEPGFEALRPFPSRRFEDVSGREGEREEPVISAGPETAEEEPAKPARAARLDDPFARFDFSRDLFSTESKTKDEAREADRESAEAKEEPRLPAVGTAPEQSGELEETTPEAESASVAAPAPELPQLPAWLRRSEDKDKTKRPEAPAPFWPPRDRDVAPAPADNAASVEEAPARAAEAPEEAGIDERTDAAQEVQEQPAAAEEPVPSQAQDEAVAAAPTVVGTYSAGGNLYVMYSDGSIEAETGRGVFRFASLDELKHYIATGEGGQLQPSGRATAPSAE